MSQRALAPALTAAALIVALSGCATAAPGAQPSAAAPRATQSASSSPEAAPSTGAPVWPAGWPEHLPHLTSGELLYSHAEADRIYKQGVVSTPEAYAQLLSDFAAAGYADEASSDHGDGAEDGDADAHNFSRDGWRVIVRGVQTGAGFEVHYLAKNV